MSSETVDPIVSVITPTYNRAPLLPRALRSVLSQDFQDLELIVVDDGSTDETPEIIASFSDPHLRCIRFPENRGIGAARHAGIEAARGELIAFIDSDDVWLPGKLEYQVSLFRKYPDVDIIFGDYHNINFQTRSIALGFQQTQRGRRYLEVSQLAPDFWQILSGLPEALSVSHVIGTASVVMLRHRVFSQIGNFRVDLSGPEDFEFWFRAAVKGIRFAYTTRPLIERHKDAQSITARTLSFVPQRLRALEYCEATAREAGRLDLIPPLNSARYRSWCGLVKEYARVGRRREALHAFSQALRYGFTPQLLLYGALALGGAQTFSLARSIRRAVVGGSR